MSKENFSFKMFIEPIALTTQYKKPDHSNTRIKTHNECSSVLIRAIKSRRMTLTGHASLTRKMRNESKTSLEDKEEWALGRPRSKWEEKVEMDLNKKNIIWIGFSCLRLSSSGRCKRTLFSLASKFSVFVLQSVAVS